MDAVEHQHPVVHRSWKRPRPVIDHGQGIYLYDTEGRRYLDAAAGTSVVCNLGHGNQGIVEAMYAQGKKVAFAAPHVFTNEPMLQVGEKILEHAPGTMRGRCRTWFSCTGSDAVDDAARLARQYAVASGRATKYVIISRWQQFHGNQIGTAAMAGHTERRRMLYPMFVNSPHIPPAFCYRCPFGDEHPGCGLKCAHALETMIRQTGEENVAAFLAEPVVGAALGAAPAPEGYFEIVREICDRYHVLLIVDEVMSAWGRTGHWFAMDHYAVTPDIIATSKGLTAGYAPVGATIAREEIWQTIEESAAPFMAGHTLSENPVCLAAAVATLEFMEQNDIVEHAREVGAYLLRELSDLSALDIVGDVRGMGLFTGLEFVQDKSTREPFPPGLRVCSQVFAEALSRGMITFPCTGSLDGVAGDMMLITPPLIVTRPEIDEIVGILRESIRAVQIQLASRSSGTPAERVHY